ncbi:MAG TPA: dTMP kinase [Actinomycetota bacterium]|nr:dTMP kinase [Actinomycetota bacterium]
MDLSHKPRLLVVEGLDGAGTTTQAALLSGALRQAGRPVHLTAEPSDGPIGRLLRSHVRGELDLDPQAAALAFTADRADHLTRTVRPALARGMDVVCDRYLLSTLAYQGAQGVDREWILRASSGLDIPAVTVFLDLPEPARRQRLESRTHVDRWDPPDLAADLRASYSESIRLLREAGQRVEVVSSAGAEQDVLREILALLPL